MEAYQNRVIDEHNELRGRADKLYVFIQTNTTFSKLPTDEQRRLREQLAVMNRYADILLERIACFPKEVSA